MRLILRLIHQMQIAQCSGKVALLYRGRRASGECVRGRKAGQSGPGTQAAGQSLLHTWAKRTTHGSCSPLQGPGSNRPETTCIFPPANKHLPAATCHRSGDQKWGVTHRPSQDGLLSEMLLLREPAHRGAHDGRDDSRPQCLLHCPHGNLVEQEVGRSEMVRMCLNECAGHTWLKWSPTYSTSMARTATR